MENENTGAYILKAGLVSPAGGSPEQLLSAVPAAPVPLDYPGQKAALKTAGYRCDLSEAKALLGPMKLRRLGRLQTMTLLAAKKAGLSAEACAGDTGVYMGTGLGSMGETAAFLENMVLNGEEFPKPANFINSVHNAAASSLALEYAIKGENITVAHRDISFDAALGHGVSALAKGRLKRAVEEKGLWKDGAGPLRPLAGGTTRGTSPGEGAAVFLLSSGAAEGALAKVLGARTARYRYDASTYLDPAASADFLCGLLAACGVKPEETGLLLSGADGDCALDAVYLRTAAELGRRAGRLVPHGSFKQYCGDYKAASGFGFGLAALLLSSGTVPPGLFPNGTAAPGPVSTVLSYTISRSGSHSAALLRSL